MVWAQGFGFRARDIEHSGNLVEHWPNKKDPLLKRCIYLPKIEIGMHADTYLYKAIRRGVREKHVGQYSNSTVELLTSASRKQGRSVQLGVNKHCLVKDTKLVILLWV